MSATTCTDPRCEHGGASALYCPSLTAPDVGLSEAERQSLLADDLALDNMHADWAQRIVFAAVEAILCTRLAAAVARAEAAEAKVARVEALADDAPWVTHRGLSPVRAVVVNELRAALAGPEES